MALLIPQPSDYYLRRWMLFVDGENLTIRSQKLAQDNGISLKEGVDYVPDVFIWIPGLKPTLSIINTENTPIKVQEHAVRAHYYTSVSGDDDRLNSVREALWSLGFQPQVFKKEKKEIKAKGVD